MLYERKMPPANGAGQDRETRRITTLTCYPTYVNAPEAVGVENVTSYEWQCRCKNHSASVDRCAGQGNTQRLC